MFDPRSSLNRLRGNLCREGQTPPVDDKAADRIHDTLAAVGPQSAQAMQPSVPASAELRFLGGLKG
jgi:hypothetical protein